MTKEEAIQALKEHCHEIGANDQNHRNADKVLCNLLFSLGFEDVVYEWENVDKWYA